jgi:hypothetical protein
MAGASTPANPGTPTTAPACKGIPGLVSANVIHCRSRDCAGGGGRLVGAWIAGWRIADDLYPCACCADLIEPGRPAFEVLSRDRQQLLLVCADCAGPASQAS